MCRNCWKNFGDHLAPTSEIGAALLREHYDNTFRLAELNGMVILPDRVSEEDAQTVANIPDDHPPIVNLAFDPKYFVNPEAE